MSSPIIRPFTKADCDSVARIFNHFILEDFAAYHSKPIDGAAIAKRLEAHPSAYPCYVIEVDSQVVGWGELRPIHHGDTLRRTAEVGYFFAPEYTGRGLGTLLLVRLESDARAMGVDNLLASISSRNEQSISFHLRKGFTECGRFPQAGRKFGQDFDVVWMHKLL